MILQVDVSIELTLPDGREFELGELTNSLRDIIRDALAGEAGDLILGQDERVVATLERVHTSSASLYRGKSPSGRPLR